MRSIRVFNGALVAVALTAVILAQDAKTTAQELTAETSASPELVGQLSKELAITPSQAQGGAGALLGLAKTKLKPEDFSQVSSAIPNTDGLLKAAPVAKGGLGSMLGSSGVGGLASLAGSFKQLGLSPEMAMKMAPVLGKFVESKGSAAAAQLLMGALK